MNPDNLWPLILILIVAVSVLAGRLRKARRLYIPDYQRGVRFVNGSFANVLGPGKYTLVSPKAQIEVVDLRPQPIFIERIPYRDVWQNDCRISIAAELLVDDARLAATKLKDQTGDSLAIIRNEAQSELSSGSSEGAPVPGDISQAINKQLGPVGMKVSNVEVVEFWCNSNASYSTDISN